MNEVNQREQFAYNLKNLIKSLGISQLEISDKLNVSASTVSDWVKGKKYPRIDAMQSLANFLGVNISDLIGEKTIQVSENSLDADEKDIISIFRSLDRRGKHRMMSMIYDFDRTGMKRG